MILKDLEKNLHFVLNALIDWFTTVINPGKKARSMVAIASTNKKKAVRLALQIWLTAFIISMIVQFPLYQSHGIAWNNLGFYCTSCFIQLTLLATGVFSVYCGLLIFKVRIPLSELFILYATVVGSYSVLFALGMYPNQMDALSVLKSAKQHGKNIIDIWKDYIHIHADTGSLSSFYLIYSDVSSHALALVSSFTTIIMSNEIVRRYSLPKHLVIEGTIFGLFVICILFEPLVRFFNYFTMYSFL